MTLTNKCLTIYAFTLIIKHSKLNQIQTKNFYYELHVELQITYTKII
jgi:hypothetical protein